MNTIHDHAVRILADTVAFRPVPHCTTGIGDYVARCERDYEGSMIMWAIAIVFMIGAVIAIVRLNK